MKKMYIFLLLMLFSASTYCQSDRTWGRLADRVLLSGEAGSWESNFVGMPSVLILDNVYHMWYSGGNDNSIQIGHATSPDGVTWTKDSQNPVLKLGATGSWDQGHVYFPEVLYKDGVFHMWYTGGDTHNHEEIGYATSTDGTVWTKYEGNPVFLRGEADTWDNIYVGTCCIFFKDELFHMYYGANGTIAQLYFKVGYATSPDGIIWTRYEQNPVFENPPSGNWDYPRVQPSHVIQDAEGYKLWYSGGYAMKWRIGFATSPDGLNWARAVNNPVFDWGKEGKWDSAQVSFPSVLFDESEDVYKMWYGGGDNINREGIGYAEAGVTSVSQNIIDKTTFIVFPNPASQNITISFNLEHKTNVKLSIFNLLGQEQLILLNKERLPGEQEVSFNVSELNKGIYIVKLISDKTTSSRLIVE